MNAAVRQDIRIGHALAQFGADAVLAHWDGSNDSIRPLTEQERLERWRDRYGVFTHRFERERRSDSANADGELDRFAVAAND